MSDTFNPGPDWVKVPDQASTVEYDEILLHYIGTVRTKWGRKPKMPPLPVEPGYYVDEDGCAWRLDTDGEWDDTFGNPLDEFTEPTVPLTRYEPRAVTAKAVLEKVRWNTDVSHDTLEPIAREFGVDDNHPDL